MKARMQISHSEDREISDTDTDVSRGTFTRFRPGTLDEFRGVGCL